VGAVETAVWFPRSLWARCPSEAAAGKASTAPAASTAGMAEGRPLHATRREREVPRRRYCTTTSRDVVGEPAFSNQSMPSLTRSNFSA